MSDVIRLSNELKENIDKAKSIKKKIYDDLVSRYPDMKDMLSDDFSDSSIILTALKKYIDVMGGDVIE